MKTKIIYDVVSTSEDIYFEQAWASAWTLKHYTPEAYIIILTDAATEKTIRSDARKRALEVIDEVVVIDFDQCYSNKEKSRWIKTNMRQLVKGDFLFIDADTIICGELTEIDNIKCGAIGAVLDNHCRSKEISSYPIFQDMYVKPIKAIFNTNYNYENDMYNSGVLLVRDIPQSYAFFDKWHENWKISQTRGECRDQLALLKTTQDLPKTIQEIDGVYNSQIRTSIQYFINSKILHTFASQAASPLSKIFGLEIYNEIKENGYVTERVAKQLLSCKHSFCSPSIMVDKRWLNLSYNPTFIVIDKLIDSNKMIEKRCLYILNFIAKAIRWVLRHLEK